MTSHLVDVDAVRTRGHRVSIRGGHRAGRLNKMDLIGTRSIRVPAGVPAGVLATITMDAAMGAASYIGGSAFTSQRADLGAIGRWAAGLLRGRWRHDDITTEPAHPAEVWLGLLTHYLTGIILTETFLLLPRRGEGRPSFLGGTAYGVATAVLPLLILFPSSGYGWFGLRSGEAGRLNRIMLLGHTAFGVGIGLWAPRAARRRARPSGPEASNPRPDPAVPAQA